MIGWFRKYHAITVSTLPFENISMEYTDTLMIWPDMNIITTQYLKNWSLNNQDLNIQGWYPMIDNKWPHHSTHLMTNEITGWQLSTRNIHQVKIVLLIDDLQLKDVHPDMKCLMVDFYENKKTLNFISQASIIMQLWKGSDILEHEIYKW